MNTHRTAKRILLVFFLFLVAGAGVPAFANGVQENRILKAKDLIAQKNYNDAILILTQVVKEEPDRLDEAQDLLNQIRNIRDQYNDDYEKLLQVLYNEQDENKALEVIKKLEELDKNPNKSTQKQVKQAKRSAQLVFSRKKFNKIMEDALVQLNKKEYAQAVQIYLTGFTLHKEEFDDNDYGEALKTHVEKSLADLKTSSGIFVQQEAAFKLLKAKGDTLFQGVPQSVNELIGPMKTLASLRRRIWQDSEDFQKQNAVIAQSGGDVTNDFFLSYSYLLSRGREKAKEIEGLLGALDRLWNENQGEWSALIRQRVEATFAEGRKRLDAQDWDGARASFRECRILSQSGMDVISLWNLQGYPSVTGAVNPDWSVSMRSVLPLAEFLETRLLLADSALQALDSRQISQGLVTNADLDRSGLDKARQTVKSQKTSFDVYSQQSAQLQNRDTGLIRAGLKLGDPPELLNSWQVLWKTYRQDTLQDEIRLVERKGQMDFGDLSQRFTVLETEMSSIQGLLNGQPRDQNGTTVLSRYPLEASQRLEIEAPKQQLLDKDIRSFVGVYEGEAAEVRVGGVAAFPGRGRDLLARLNQLQLRQVQLLQNARENYARSLALKKQGQDQIAVVERAITAENFTQARASLNQASGNFAQSLNLQEDLAFRKIADEQARKLMEAILKGENELVVRDVRKLLTQGSQAYLTGQYPNAEQILLRAQNRWATTNADPNPEIVYWLNLVNFALSVSTGREISPTDPLFNEIQQLLNLARSDYDTAVGLLKNGRKSDALVLLDRAKGTLGKVLLPFPVNQEARVLNLLIQKSSSPDVFDQLFSDSFKAAVAKLSYNAPEAYNDLQDYQRIQPDYPGMDDAIYRAKIVLKIIRPAPNPADLRESRNLTVLARRIYDSQKIDQFQSALDQVNRAIQLDPENTEAQDLKDRLSLYANNLVATMTPSQQQEFSDIEQLFTAGNYLQCKARLLQFITRFPSLKADPKVKNLDRRLQAAS